MKQLKSIVAITSLSLLAILMIFQSSFAQVKIGYINSQKILLEFKEAQDVQKQLDAKSQEWQKQVQDMQVQLKNMNDQLESQSLLLSQEKKAEKQKEMQDLYAKMQQFQNEKWGQSGELFKLQQDLLKPIYGKINTVLEKLGKADKFDYIFDGVAGNIVYVNPDQPDLTEKVLEELNKGLKTKTAEKKK
ncbi:MAG TPA: OmpH family outer membrane protein [Bacteroidetes bacterium]|nr:OmpH family outer membrane protein [Bacteroidota bacterium]